MEGPTLTPLDIQGPDYSSRGYLDVYEVLVEAGDQGAAFSTVQLQAQALNLSSRLAA